LKGFAPTISNECELLVSQKKKFSDERMREGIFFVGLAINVDENCD
jgi:hypothetical protein